MSPSRAANACGGAMRGHPAEMESALDQGCGHRDFDWTRHVSSGAREWLAAAATSRRFAHRTTIYEPGDTITTFFQIVSGAIRQFIVDADGREVLIYIYQPGDFVADSSAVDGEPYPVWIETKGATSLRCWDIKDLAKLRAAFPEVETALIGQLSQRLHIALLIIQQLSTLSAPGRIAARLGLLRQFGQKHTDGSLEISQDDLAAMTNSTRQTVNETLAELRSRRIIETSYRGVLIVDPAALDTFWHNATRDRHAH